MAIKNPIRTLLRKRRRWLEFQEVRREGFAQALRRRGIQKGILTTPPVRTDVSGKTEVRILTWRRDWINAIWALKSFYHFSHASYPLYIHDGGLLPWQCEQLKAHFPDAKLISRTEGDNGTLEFLQSNGWGRCTQYRGLNPTCRKLFDFFVLSQAEHILSIDSDIVFFRRPTELLQDTLDGRNLYNKDASYWYSLSLDELEEAFGIRPPPRINSGLSLVKRTSIDFDRVNMWLQNPELFADRWVTEQTLHALCSTLHGVDFLPNTYLVSTEPGLPVDIVCKHYPGFFRPLLYNEGMTALVNAGFLHVVGGEGHGTSADPGLRQPARQ